MTTRPGIPKFKGGFRKFAVTIYTNREKGTISRLLVYSQGSRVKVHEYLWLKYLWDELTKKEMELFLTMPETLSSEIKYAALRAVLIKGKKHVRDRLINSPFLTGEDTPTRIRYQGFQRLDVEIQNEQLRSLPKVPKFSGWIKSSSAKDRGSARRPSFLDPLAVNEEDYVEHDFDWFTHLTSSD